MPDRDFTPTPERPSARRPGRQIVPDDGDREEGADPPTVRSGSPIGSKSNGSAERRVKMTSIDAPALPVPGMRVGDFGLEEAIGAGGMGAVFRAVDIKLDRLVALKILPPDQAIDPDVVQRYYQEGRAAARLDHENIARIYSIGHEGPYHYICFEYIEGTTIRQRVERDGPMSIDDAINYTLQIANALVHAAERGVVHRDIKPSNIIVTPHGRAKLVDMGLARRFERGEDTGLTQSGMTLGTFDYISPEQARDPRDVDVRGDLYSLGCTLFHMLSGRPPFPEGTVLQKLIQHQEEAPPDIRKLNPAVPDDLASILVKLMAKDRDRRYQTPELLVRDLLTVAGALGLRSINPEGLVWMAPKPVPAWMRHVVWGVPALAFVAVMGWLAWWGDGPGVAVENPSPRIVNSVGTTDLPVAKLPKRPVVEPEPPAPVERLVGSRDDFAQLLIDSPPKSTFLLSDKGPYDLRGFKAPATRELEFTIRAEPGIRPVIRLPRESSTVSSSKSLLDLVGGRVTLDGLDFVVDGSETEAAIRAEGTELIIRRCTFRRVGSSSSRPGSAAIVVKGAVGSMPKSPERRGISLEVDASEFDGGQVGIWATGPVDLALRNCTFGPAQADQANLQLDNPDSRAIPAEVRLSHLSVLAGSGPVFRIQGLAPRIRVNDSVFAPPTLNSVAGTLVVLDSSDRLDWRGIDNLYGRFGVYLQRPSKLGARASVATFAAWADDSSSFLRESGSFSTETHVWRDPDPLQSLARLTSFSGPTQAFQLALPRQAPPNAGTRQGPLGPLPSAILAATSSTSVTTDPSPLPETISLPSKVVETPVPTVKRPREQSEPGGEIAQMPIAIATDRSANQLLNDDADAATATTEVPMPIQVDPERPTPVTIATMPPPSTASPSMVPSRSDPVNPSVVPATSGEPAVIRTVEEFRTALSRTVAGVKTLTIAADADWVVPSFSARGMSSLVIRGDRGTTRPRLRFRGEMAPGLGLFFPAIAAALPEPWAAWITLQSGGLKLEGIDLVFPEPKKSTRRRTVFAIAAGSNDLTLTDCSVTIEGDETPSTIVELLAGEPAGDVRVSIKNCLLRSGGDLVDVSAGRRIDLDIDNAVIATGGTLLHGHGWLLGRNPEPIKIGLRQVTARTLGGLIHLQSSDAEPELPRTDIKSRDSIFTTGDPEVPLLRVDGQGDIEDLLDTIHWESRSVAYYQINIYRRDQSAQPGAVPKLYNREFWSFKLNRLEESPNYGDLKFLNEAALARSPWTLRPDDVRLDPESRKSSVGADLLHVPNANLR